MKVPVGMSGEILYFLHKQPVDYSQGLVSSSVLFIAALSLPSSENANETECLKKQVLGQAVLGSILAGSARIFTVQVASHSAWVCKHRDLLYRRVSE